MAVLGIEVLKMMMRLRVSAKVRQDACSVQSEEGHLNRIAISMLANCSIVEEVAEGVSSSD